MFVSLVQETVISTSFSVLAIVCVVLLITASPTVAIITVFSVLMIDLFLVALIALWGITFNNVTLVHLVASLGISVLYAAHISHTFLLVEAPTDIEKRQQRIWKA